jgi:hypothetical protein
MNIEDQLQRQININMQLRRQLETARRDAVEYCAKYCEEHAMRYNEKLDKLVIAEQPDGRIVHTGHYYAEGLRGIIGNARKD